MMRFGQALIAVRTARKLTQAGLGDLIFYTAPYISMIEAGKRMLTKPMLKQIRHQLVKAKQPLTPAEYLAMEREMRAAHNKAYPVVGGFRVLPEYYD